MAQYVPSVEDNLTVTLPGETVRALVVGMHNRDTALVRLVNAPPNIAKMHTYRLDDLVPVRRRAGLLGEFWEAIDERLLVRQREEQAKQAEAARKRPARKRKVAKKKAVAKKGAKRAAASRK